MFGILNKLMLRASLNNFMCLSPHTPSSMRNAHRGKRITIYIKKTGRHP